MIHERLFKYIRYLFIVSLICLPFNRIYPEFRPRFIAGMMSSELAIFPLIIIVIIVLYNRWKYKQPLYQEKAFVSYSLIYVVILLLSLIIGLFIYPYYDGTLFFVNQQLPEVISILNTIQLLKIPTNFTYQFGIILIATKLIYAAIIRYIWTFGISYIIFNCYRNRVNELKQDLLNGISILLGILIVFSCIEAVHQSGVSWGTDIVKFINPYFYLIGEDQNGQWPPLIWEYQFRSVTPEPSFLAMILGFLLPFVWYKIYQIKNHIIKSLWMFILLIATILLFLTQSRTATMTYVLELIALNLILLINSIKSKLWRTNSQYIIRIISVTIVALFCSIQFISNFMTPPAENFSKVVNFSTYMNNNFISVRTIDMVLGKNLEVDDDKVMNDSSKVDDDKVMNNSSKVDDDKVMNNSSKETRSSNISRKENIRMELDIFKAHPILGVGTGLSGMYKTDLVNSEEMNNELSRWTYMQRNVGIIKSIFPVASQYTTLLAEQGILGLICFLLPEIFCLWILVKQIYNDSNLDMFSVSILISLLGFTFIGLTTSFYLTYMYWIILSIAGVIVFEIKNADCKIKLNK